VRGTHGIDVRLAHFERFIPA